MSNTKELLKVRKEAVEFFEDLIKLTGTYFLSDYVEDVRDYVGEKATKMIIEQRNELKIKCDTIGLSFHSISCDVANPLVEAEFNKKP